MFKYYHLPNKEDQTSLVKVPKEGQRKTAKIREVAIVFIPSLKEDMALNDEVLLYIYHL